MKLEEQEYVDCIDINYAYKLAKRLEQYRTNEVLGYRTAGSGAEAAAGEMLRAEMEAIGFKNVRKDEIHLDSWEFEKAVLRYCDLEGLEHECQLGAYQTNFHTEGFEEFPVVYVGKGTASDYAGLDVTGKLVLADINQREEWWISYPVYEAHVRGAAAFLAVQVGGYGEIDDTALNAQDIGGPENAPAFSISRADAAPLRELLMKNGEARAAFDARSTVKRDCVSWNIVGEIPGQMSAPGEESMILLSAHYDSYFSGFQDDNAAVGMMLGIGRALLGSGYHPRKTIVFCAMAAEEWGVTDSKYDWSTGAWQQVSAVCPEWAGKVVADINFELPAHAHDRKDGVRCVYEYASFLNSFLKGIEVDRDAYPEGIEVHCPVQTMSDDFSMAISGIPSMVNDFTSGPFMETHYHTQFDNDEYYNEAVYRFHHELYGRLIMAFDRLAVAPFDFERLFSEVRDSLDLEFSARVGARGEILEQLVREAAQLGREMYEKITAVNEMYERILSREAGCRNGSGEETEAQEFFKRYRKMEAALFSVFKKAQDSLVRLDWHDEVLFPHEAVRGNLKRVRQAVWCLEQGEVRGTLEAVYEIDNNRYAFQFDRAVFCHFTDSVMSQKAERLQWGAGRIVRHENLFDVVQQLKEKLRQENPDLTEELFILRRVGENQKKCYLDDIEYMIHAFEKMIQQLKEINQA